MDEALVIARLILTAVFAVAGVAKLADLPGSRAAAADFGVPDRLAWPLGTVLPLAELTIAALFVPAATATGAGFAALALLLLFSVGIGASMARGETPECHCFGQLHSEPAGPKTLARNLILAAVAAFVAFGGAGSQPGIWGDTSPFGAGTWVILGGALALAILLWSGGATLLSLLRRNGVLLLRVKTLEEELTRHGIPIPDTSDAEEMGLPVGTEAPGFELPAVNGGPTTLGALLSGGHPALLVFSSPRCGPCEGLMPKVATWQRELSGELIIAVVAEGNREDNEAKLREHGLRNVLIQGEDDVAGRYGAYGTPSAVLVGLDGRIASPLAAGSESISTLIVESAPSDPPLEIVRVP